MPRGYYGKNRPAPTQNLLPAAPAPAAIVVGATPEGDGGSSWKPAVFGVLAVTGVVALGAATTSFTGSKRSRGYRKGSPFRALY